MNSLRASSHIFLIVLAALAACSPASHEAAGSSHDRHAGNDGHDGDVLMLTEEALRESGVVVEAAAPGVVRTEIDLPGEIVLDADHVAHIVPRFAGVVQRVNKKLGDRVSAGDVLAVVQSNVSVAPYEVTSMIGGTIIEKHITLGEYVRDDADVFVVADLTTVWVNVSVYARFLAQVRVGQRVRITSPGIAETASGRIDYVGPLVGESTRTGIARLVLDNRGGRWQPGLFVTAHITVAESREAVAVPDDAVQTVGGESVVFVRHDDGFLPREVTLGRRGGGMVAIESGLAAGEEYVARNSFIFKAELGKSTAGHSH